MYWSHTVELEHVFFISLLNPCHLSNKMINSLKIVLDSYNQYNI